MKTTFVPILLVASFVYPSLLFSGEKPVYLSTNNPDWTPEYATLFLSDTGLRVHHLGQKRPRLSIKNVQRSGSFKVKIRTRVTNPGSVGMAWVMTRENASPRRRSFYKKVKPQDAYQTISFRVPVPESGVVSDFVIFLPWGDSSVKKIVFAEENGEKQSWVFAEEISQVEMVKAK